MTEAEWLACADAQVMLRCHYKPMARHRRKARGRKLRLFGCGSCRQMWAALTDPRSRAAVEYVERWADGEVDGAALARLREEAREASAAVGLRQHTAGTGERNPDRERDEGWAAEAALVVTAKDASLAVVADPALRMYVGDGDPAKQRAWRERLRQLAHLLRDLLGNPFRPVTLSPAERPPQAVDLARAAYEQRGLPSGELDRVRLAVLADALEEAGCTNADLLGHLRGPGPHVRGCWAVDLILGKA